MAKPSPYHPAQNHHSVDAKSSGLSVSQMLAAGLASVGAAVFTSRFGVAGTVLGAALTTMIITGGSAILKSYLETIAGHVQSVPQRVGAGQNHRNRMRAGRGKTAVADRDLPDAPPPGMTVYSRGGRIGGRGIFAKIGSSFGWFSRLSGVRKVGILLGAAVPAVAVFVIAMSAITSVEIISGRSLSCITGNACQQTISSGGTSSTTFGTLASAARSSSSGGSEQPFDQQLASPELTPDEGVQQSNGSGGFFGQPESDGSDVPASGNPSSGTPAGEIPSGTEEVPADDGSVQPAAPTEQPGETQEEVAPVEVQPSEVQ